VEPRGSRGKIFARLPRWSVCVPARKKGWEWFEWLVEQLERHNVTKTSLEMGAPTVYRDWQP
jgi:hypothetical protein